MRYRVQRGLFEVKAVAGPGDTVRFSKVTGEIEVDPDAPPGGARAELAVDVRAYDAGERFKNWTVESELGAEQHPTATFKLTRVENVSEDSSGKFRGQAVGQLSWRDARVDVRFKGQATLTRRELEIRGSFDVDIGKLAFAPTAFRMFREGTVVRVEVHLLARA